MGESIIPRRGTPVWESRRLYLYNEGDECTSLTGGWMRGGASNGSYTFTKNATNIVLYAQSTNGCVGAVTTNKVDMSNYSKISLLCDVYQTTSGSASGESWNFWGLSPTSKSWTRGSNPSDFVKLTPDGEEDPIRYNGTDILLTYSIDAGSVYPVIEASWGYQCTVQITIKQLWLE